ncbi:MAG: hypothetical protein WC315_00350 [Candidatus Omnitrophota bacterium]|jgi:hypothetical protein
MLSIGMLVEFIKDLRGIVPEPARSEIAHRLGDLISNVLRNADNDNYRRWVSEDRLRFLRHCELVNLDRWVPDDLYIEPTVLAEFCNRWMSCNLFKIRNDPSAEWKPITPEMNGLRVTMIEELRSLDKAGK